MKHLHPTLSAGTVQTPPRRLQPVIGNLLPTLDFPLSIQSLSIPSFSFTVINNYKKSRQLCAISNLYPTTPSSDTSPQEFTLEECKMPGAAPGDPGGAWQSCSTTETPQQTQQVLCYKLLNHHARVLMPALVQNSHYPISRLQPCAGCGCKRT